MDISLTAQRRAEERHSAILRRKHVTRRANFHSRGPLDPAGPPFLIHCLACCFFQAGFILSLPCKLPRCILQKAQTLFANIFSSAIHCKSEEDESKYLDELNFPHLIFKIFDLTFISHPSITRGLLTERYLKKVMKSRKKESTDK